ncbi:MAG TPA: YicC/YloC family endoribonuclease [Edaphobacter sp.]
MTSLSSPLRSPIRSMTGFASVDSTLSDGASFTLSLKSVNHRFLDLHLRLPSGLDALETEIRRILKAGIERGHVEVTLDFNQAATSGHRINDEVLDSIVTSLRQSMTRLGLSGAPDIGSLLRLPGVFTTEARGRRQPLSEAAPPILAALTSALQQLHSAREGEGAQLEQELRDGMARLHAATDLVIDLRRSVRQALFDRLRARLQELLSGGSISEDRLLTEAGILAEKSDIEEEAVRLRAHIERFLAILDEGGAVGKRLDFLLQEFNREANTVLSKTGSAAGPDSLRITNLGLEMKSEIERAREQVQNLE